MPARLLDGTAVAREIRAEVAQGVADLRRRTGAAPRLAAVLVGDIHPGEAAERAGHLTPVPGGVGPLTIACLLRNALRAARLRRGGASR